MKQGFTNGSEVKPYCGVKRTRGTLNDRMRLDCVRYGLFGLQSSSFLRLYHFKSSYWLLYILV